MGAGRVPIPFPMPRLARLLAAALVLLPAGSAPAAAQEPSRKDLTFDVTTGPGNDVPCRIVARLHLPTGVTGREPVPAILATNGFGGSRNDFDTLGPAFARRGYAFLAYSGLGFGGSSCKITLDDPDWDGKAGSQLVTWLGQQDFVVKDQPGDPRVGMIGGSYGGQAQFAIAGIDRRVDAIVPQITWNDLEYSLAGNNADFVSGVSHETPGVVKLDWPVLFTALGASGITSGDPSKAGACPNFADQVCPGLVTSGALGYADPTTRAFLRRVSVASYVSKIRIPTFLIQGQRDTLFNIQEAVATWKALRAQGTPVKMLWRSAGHSGGAITGEWNAGEPEKAYESRLALEFLDFYLRGVGDPPRLDLSFYRGHVKTQDDAAPAVGVTPSYPAGADRPFFLSGSSGLASARDAVQAGTAVFATTAAPTGSGGGAVTPGQLEDAPGSFAAFTTEPLTEDLDVAGIPSVSARISAPVHAVTQAAGPAGMLVLFARLVDVAPDGTVSVPGEIVSSVRVPDVTKPVRFELPGIVHRFAKGHRLRVVISQGNAFRRGNSVAGPVAIQTDKGSPSVLTLPVTGRPGTLGAGPSGTTLIAPAPGSPPSQPAGLGGPQPAVAAAPLPENRRCVSRRSFKIRIARAPRGDRVTSATVTVNGKRVKTVRGKRLRAAIDLRGLPAGTVRVLVTARTRKGRTLRSARTYRTCASKKR